MEVNVRGTTVVRNDNFDTIAARYLDDPTRVAPDMRRGSRLAAARLGLRMATTRAIDLDDWERTRDYPLISNGLRADQNPDWRAAADRGELSLLATPADRQPLARPV